MRGTYRINLLNLNITTHCPLSCPICFKEKRQNFNLEMPKAISIIRDASRLGVKYINIMGGEPLLNDDISYIIKSCFQNNIATNLATSGYGLTSELLNHLFESGLSNLFISLNGSTVSINSMTRSDFERAEAAIDLTGKMFPSKLIILWVLTSYNAMDFCDFLDFINKRNIYRVSILKLKYFDGIKADYYPSSHDIEYIAACIKKYSYKFNFYIDSCYPELIKYMHPDTNYEGFCDAGIKHCSVNANGTFSPCTHWDISEGFSTLVDYWQHSEVLRDIRAEKITAACNWASFDYTKRRGVNGRECKQAG